VFGTLLLASNYHPVRIACFAWMPFQFLLAERLGRDDNRAAFPWLALVAFFQLLAGYPEFLIDIGFLLAVVATVSYFTGKWKRSPLVTVPLMALAFALGALAAGAQLIPLAELARISARTNFAKQLYQPNEWMMNRPVPIGTVPGLMVFVVVALFQKRARPAAVVFFVCWLISIGGWKWLRLLPVFSLVRFPFGWVLLALFPFGWLTAIGCDALIEPRRLRPRLASWLLGFVGVSGGLFALFWLHAWNRSRHGRFSFFDVNIGTPAAVVLGALGGVSLLFVAVLALRGRAPIRAAWLVPLSLLTLSHLAAVPHVSESAPFDPPSQAGLVAQMHGSPRSIRGRTFSVHDILYGFEITDRLRSPLGIEISFLPQRCLRIMERLGFIPTFGALDWVRFMTARGFLDSMDVEYVGGPIGLSPLMGAHGFSMVRRLRGDALFRNPGAMGRAWVNYAARRIDDPERVLDRVLGSEFDPRTEVIIEAPLKTNLPTPSPETRIATPVEDVVRRSPTDVELTVQLSTAGVLVVSESSYPGWVATVDGENARWFTVDYILRGLELSSGKHVVRYRYRPTSVRLGLAASAVGLLAILFCFARYGVRSRASRPGARP
jgi:hypothetical protein